MKFYKSRDFLEKLSRYTLLNKNSLSQSQPSTILTEIQDSNFSLDHHLKNWGSPCNGAQIKRFNKSCV